MKRFSVRFSVGLLAGLMGLWGCAPQTPSTEKSSPASRKTPPSPAAAERTLKRAETPVFAVIPKQKDNPVFSYARAGALAQGEKLGVEILWNAPERNDEAKQAQLVETFIRQGVDGIAISCSNPDTLKRPIDKAVEAGIPVVTWDSDSPHSKRRAFFGLDDYRAGRILGEELGELLQGQGSVALMAGVPGAQNLTLRLQGVNDVFRGKFPGIEVVKTVYCNDDIPYSVQLVNSVMSENPDLSGWGMVGGWPLFAKNGLNAITPGQTKVVSVDPLPDCWHWIEDGYAQVMIGQKVFDWGAKSVELLYKLYQGKELTEADENGFVDSGVDLVVLDPSQFPDPDRYIALEDYKKMFREREAAIGS